MTVVSAFGVVKTPVAVTNPLPFVQSWKAYCFAPPITLTLLAATIACVDPVFQLLNCRVCKSLYVYGTVSIDNTVPEASPAIVGLVVNEIIGHTSTCAAEEVTIARVSALSVT